MGNNSWVHESFPYASAALSPPPRLSMRGPAVGGATSGMSSAIWGSGGGGRKRNF